MTAMCKVIDSFGLRRRQFELARKFKRPLIKEMAVLSRPLQLIETDEGANITFLKNKLYFNVSNINAVFSHQI